MPFWKRNKRAPDLEGLSKIRGAKSSASPLTRTLQDGRQLRRVRPPRSMTAARTLSQDWAGGFAYTGANRGDFYRWLRNSIPIISAGVWAWVRLCSTRMTRDLEASSDAERERASEILAALDARILEMPYGRGSGLERLAEAYFLELFTTGRFAGEAVVAPDESRVDHFRFIDPFAVSWQHGERGWEPLIEEMDNGQRIMNNSGSDTRGKTLPADGGKRNGDYSSLITHYSLPIPPDRFFYSTLGTDLTNPGGVEPLATIPFVTEIEQLMLEDMARSSHNAGTPRLQVKIARPERYSWEGDPEYNTRSNQYFDAIVGEFGTLDADDNIFTWGDVEVTMIGGSGKMWDWRLNREQVVDDVITGLKLFPWLLGRSQKATQQWVQSQYDILTQMVEAQRKTGADLIDWLCNMELRMNKINAVVRHRFDTIPDPFRLDRARAAEVEIRNADTKVQRGYISKDDGAREMGYDSAFKSD